MKLNRRERMEYDLAEVTDEVVRAQSEADSANERLARLQKEQLGLQAALDIMDGKQPAPADDTRQRVIDALARLAPPCSDGSALMACAAAAVGAGPLGLKPKADIVFNAPEGWTKGTLNGEEILLEPGMAVMKNSFNEEVIAKIGTVFMPMNEPTKPEGLGPLLPPLESDDFMSDAELLDG